MDLGVDRETCCLLLQLVLLLLLAQVRMAVVLLLGAEVTFITVCGGKSHVTNLVDLIFVVDGVHLN